MTENIFRGVITVERKYDVGSPQSLMDAMTAFAALQAEAKKTFDVEAKSSTAKRRDAGEE